MVDKSELDRKYFIDEEVYNCPFCNRRNVQYWLRNEYKFDWTNDKKCYSYTVECSSCGHHSMHLSFTDIPVSRSKSYIPDQFEQGLDLDELFFYSVPTSFFVLDSKIPRIIRGLFSEAEGCLKSNFLTGASACARKVIYELANIEGAQGENYDDRIKSLKRLKPDVDSTYFDTLLTIQQITSEKVHEDAYDGWESNHIRLILASQMEILDEIYVIPERRTERRKAILELKKEILEDEGSKETDADESP